MKINKWCFTDFKDEICNFNYIKTLPFCVFSDSKMPEYELIGEVLDSICYDRDKLVVLGKNTPPFGYHINIEDPKVNNELLNSCQFSFIFSRATNDSKFLIKSIMAGVIPICNEDHPYIKQLGLSPYSIDVTKQNILDKLVEIKYNSHIFHHRTYWLSWRYAKIVDRLRKKNKKQKQ